MYVAHMSIRVILAEDDFLMREGIRRVLDAAPGITVTAECADGDELLAAVDADSPDIVVTDSNGTYAIKDVEGIDWIEDERMSYDDEIYVKTDENDDTMYFSVWDS